MSVERRHTGSWRARIRIEGREVSRSFKKRSDAERWEREQLAARDRGNWVDPSNPVTFVDYARQWAAARPHRGSTAQRVESSIKNHIEPTPLGRMRLVAIKPSHLQAWATDRSKVMKASTLHNLVSMVRSMLTDAAHDGLIGSSPAVRIRIPPVIKTPIVPLTPEQVWAWVDAMPERVRAMLVVQAGCGCRIGEVRGLRVGDVDFLRRELRITVQRAPRQRETSDPKTPASVRVVPLPSVVGDALAEHLRRFPAGEDGTLFVTSYGNPWESRYLDRQYKRGAKVAGLPVSTSSHDLRHTYASNLLQAGESVATVAARLGHENASLVAEVYAHLMPGREDHTRRAIDAVMVRPDSVLGGQNAATDG